MVTRRHPGVLLFHTEEDASTTTPVSSPIKEDVRRRLFDTPQKPTRSRKWTSWKPKHWSKHRISVFLCVGVSLLMSGATTFLVRRRSGGHSRRVEGDVAVPTVRPATRNRYSSPLRKSRTVPLAKRPLQSLQEKDWNQYTIRINTWQRPEQLVASVAWHVACPGVAQIQVVWCDPDHEPPAELLAMNQKYGTDNNHNNNHYYEKIVIERHEENSLNERFRILIEPPTLGILSMDDDVLRPCEAIDAGFFKWTEAPDRMVGFDGRLHVEHEDGSWQYGYMSTTEKANRYSMSLTRYCFLHRDYLDTYINELPLSVLDNIAKNFNGEDIAMSFLISSLTDGKPPLLADTWAIKSMVKLYVEKKISGGRDHKHLRDICIDSFAQILGLKESGSSRRLQTAKLYHQKDSTFDCGDTIREKLERYPKSDRQVQLKQMLDEWRKKGNVQKEVHRLMSGAAFDAYKRGLIEKSDPWKERFRTK